MWELPICAKGQAKVTASAGLRVRRGPGIEHETVGKLKFGESVDVWGVQDGWAIVQTQDGSATGWSSSDWLVGNLVN